ncbi:hypothetical protein [Hugenholtzia roseola]|uniref:hypothetical protein n=1 Tax=Hugenholtzia roseola TaxID=1002 RepID=UPI0003FEC2A1|nr:hypothetical protein [Hugenholtzia roseola]
MKNKKSVIALLLLFLCGLFLSCQEKVQIEGFDETSWKADTKACQDKRAPLASLLFEQRTKLKDLSEMQIRDLLGAPNQTELIERQQKQYLYFIKPHEKNCKQPDTQSDRQANDATLDVLLIRFNAVQQVNEVVLTKK